MKASEMLKKINTLLGVQVELEELILDNGTRIFADSYDKGESVFIVTEDSRVPLPEGEYIIEDGRMLIVKEEGLIDELRLESIDEARSKFILHWERGIELISNHDDESDWIHLVSKLSQLP